MTYSLNCLAIWAVIDEEVELGEDAGVVMLNVGPNEVGVYYKQFGDAGVDDVEAPIPA